jgi:hypothetical protein
VLAVLLVTNLEAGPGASVELLRAYPLGNCGTLAFLAAFACLTPLLGPAAGFGLGYLMALCVLVALGRRATTAKPNEPGRAHPSLVVGVAEALRTPASLAGFTSSSVGAIRVSCS